MTPALGCTGGTQAWEAPCRWAGLTENSALLAPFYSELMKKKAGYETLYIILV